MVFDVDLDAQLSDIYTKLRDAQLQQAGRACEQLVEQHPDSAAAWLAFSRLWFACRDFDRAGGCANKAVQLEPESVEARVQLAQCHSAVGDHLAALALAGTLLNEGLAHPTALALVAEVLREAGQIDAALQCALQSLQADEGNLRTASLVAGLLVMTGNTAQAERMFDELIVQRPEGAQAYYERAQLRIAESAQRHLDQIDTALASATSDAQRTVLEFARAIELDVLERYDEAFQALETGCALKRKSLDSQPRVELELLDQARSTLSQDVRAEDRGSPSGTPTGADLPTDAPIVVIGWPGPGPERVERILAAHPDVTAGGALDEFGFLLRARLQRAEREPDAEADSDSSPNPNPNSDSKTDSRARSIAETIDGLDLSGLGEEYLQRARARTQAEQYWTDTTPTHALHAGVVHRALPEARIVLVEGRPLRECLSALAQLAPDGRDASSYETAELAAYYAKFLDLMAHWKQVLPADRLTTVSLDALDRDPESSIDRLLSFCNLSRQDACHAASRDGRSTDFAVSHYREQLRPLAERLREHGIDVEA